jgi:hypothetical protein
MKNQFKFKGVVEIIFTKRVYQRNPWFIPIVKLGERNFRTGQELTYEEMTGHAPLSPEKAKEYPFIINPERVYSVIDRTKFNAEDPKSLAFLTLMAMSGKIAKSQQEYQLDPFKYDGYFYDKESEAMSYNSFSDVVYRAETLVRQTPIEDYSRLILILNYRIRSGFNVSPKGVSADYMRSKLIEAAKKWPQVVLNCFPENNPGIETELFILELVHYGIITQNAQGDIYFGQDFIASNIEEVKKLLTKEAYTGMKNRWGLALQKAKGGPLPDHIEADPGELTKTFVENVKLLKEAINEKDLQKSLDMLTICERLEKKLKEEGKEVLVDLESFKMRIDLMTPDPKVSAELEELQKQINNPANTHLKKSECKTFWTDVEKLKEYIASKKPVNVK